jgi:hypothetical protein
MALEGWPSFGFVYKTTKSAVDAEPYFASKLGGFLTPAPRLRRGPSKHLQRLRGRVLGRVVSCTRLYYRVTIARPPIRATIRILQGCHPLKMSTIELDLSL